MQNFSIIYLQLTDHIKFSFIILSIIILPLSFFLGFNYITSTPYVSGQTKSNLVKFLNKNNIKTNDKSILVLGGIPTKTNLRNVFFISKNKNFSSFYLKKIIISPKGIPLSASNNTLIFKTKSKIKLAASEQCIAVFDGNFTNSCIKIICPPPILKTLINPTLLTQQKIEITDLCLKSKIKNLIFKWKKQEKEELLEIKTINYNNTIDNILYSPIQKQISNINLFTLNKYHISLEPFLNIYNFKAKKIINLIKKQSFVDFILMLHYKYNF